MKFAFCTIVCNNSELIAQWINHYSRFGDCYVVEGATSDWKRALKWSGHNSTDGTVEIIQSSGVPHTIAKRPWKDKTEQCNEFMKHIAPDTDYLFYVDSDEFYLPSSIEAMRLTLKASLSKPITFASVQMYHWWKHPEYYCTGGDGWAYDTPIPRIWKWHKGAIFSSHRPPTIYHGFNDLSKVNPLGPDSPGYGLVKDMRCRHYSYCFRQQVLDKLKYYSVVFNRDYMEWFHEVWETWTPKTRRKLESKLSVHPSCTSASTVYCPEILHPIEVPWERLST